MIGFTVLNTLPLVLLDDDDVSEQEGHEHAMLEVADASAHSQDNQAFEAGGPTHPHFGNSNLEPSVEGAALQNTGFGDAKFEALQKDGTIVASETENLLDTLPFGVGTVQKLSDDLESTDAAGSARLDVRRSKVSQLEIKLFEDPDGIRTTSGVGDPASHQVSLDADTASVAAQEFPDVDDSNNNNNNNNNNNHHATEAAVGTGDAALVQPAGSEPKPGPPLSALAARRNGRAEENAANDALPVDQAVDQAVDPAPDSNMHSNHSQQRSAPSESVAIRIEDKVSEGGRAVRVPNETAPGAQEEESADTSEDPQEATSDSMNDPNAMETPPPLSKAEQLLHLQTLQAGMISPPVFKTQAPLPEKYMTLLRKLYRTPLLLTRDRVREALARARSRISCGGSEVVHWRTWNELQSAANYNSLNAALPERQPLLPALARQIQGSICFNHTVYKKPNCTMERDLFEDDPMLREFPMPSCAVVGNSGRLRKENHAKNIDGHDIVIRFNQGKTQGFEKMVGKKSSFRMFNAPFVGPKQGGEVTIAQMRDAGLRTWVNHVERRGVENTFAYMFDPEFLCHTWEWVDRLGKKPSSGLVGILFALHMCKRGAVSVFGFQYDAYFDKEMRPHYFDWERPKPGREGVHPFAEEKSVLETLEAAGLLKLYI